MLCTSWVLLACWVLGGFVHVKRFKIGRYDRNGFNNPVHLPTHWYGSNMVIVIEVWSVQKETNMQNMMKHASCKWNATMLFMNVLCKRMVYSAERAVTHWWPRTKTHRWPKVWKCLQPTMCSPANWKGLITGVQLPSIKSTTSAPCQETHCTTGRKYRLHMDA